MIFDYSYDSTGKIQMVVYRENATATPECYYYALNSRDNVIGIYESDGDLYAEYTYDAWGNITSITNSSVDSIANYENIATRQPFRYRGYYYDLESELYYVTSRYYDPVTHRFINADDISLITASTNTLTDKNLYAYCDNNPIIRADNGGELWEVVVVSAAIGFAVGFISSVADDLISGKSFSEVNWGAACASGGFGALSGALAVLPIPTGAFVAANAAISGLDSVVSQGLRNGFDKINYGEVALSTTIGAVSSATGPSLSRSNSKHIIKQTSVRKNKVASNPSSYTARKNASKYYRSQTSTIKNNYYKKTARSGFFSTVANAIASWFRR